MTVKRVMGTETEYAVSLNTPDRYNPVQLSFDVVNGAADSHSKSIRWDYRQEDPVNDARGTRLERAAARPDMLTDAPQLNITNVIAPNGGRVYVDHAHPEYSAPETTDPFEAVRYDHAGDLIMQAATERARTQTGTPIALHRNNVDGKGSCWGTHENYMMARAVPFDLVTRLMTLHFVTRQIYAGSGRVGIGENSEIPGYQLSQRADYIHAKVGLQTTFERPIINTRDESHSTDAYRRLHVIVGDSNMCEATTMLKVGTASLVLEMIEAGVPFRDFSLDNPIRAIREVSHDLTGRRPVRLAGGRQASALDIQREYEDGLKQIRDRVNQAARGLGVEIVDVRLRRVDLLLCRVKLRSGSFDLLQPGLDLGAAEEDLVEDRLPGGERRTVVRTGRCRDGRHRALFGEL